MKDNALINKQFVDALRQVIGLDPIYITNDRAKEESNRFLETRFSKKFLDD